MSATSSGGAGPSSSSGTVASSSLPPANQLCLAASRGDCETIRGLVKNGAKFDTDENGRTALHYAANLGKTVALKLCLQLGCELDLQDKNGCTALHRAVLDGQVDTVKVLLYEGCAVDRQDENGNTALHEAAWGGYSKIIELLIKRGKAHVHVANKHGHKPVHLSCQNGHNESTRLLLRAGSNPNTKNNNGDTPLHVSCLFGHIACTRILISAGSNINIKNKDGNTPLHVAAGLGKQKITKVLLEAKCDTNLRNNNDITAVEMARRNNHAETVLMILSAHRLWRGKTPRHKPRKSKSSKDNSNKKKKDQDSDEDEADHAGPAPRVKGRREINEDEKHKRQEARRRTEERMLMEENYDKWRELQGTLLRQELRKQTEIHSHTHGKAVTGGHSDCKACIQKLENQIEASKEKMLFELETAKARFEHKLQKMDRKMMHQSACMDRLCQERIKAEATECLHRIDKRAIEERAAWAEENDARLDIVKDDLRGWVEERLRDVQKQLKTLNDREGKAGRGLRVRSKSESDLGNMDSMDETEITDTDGEDIKGIVMGRGKGDNREEEDIDGDDTGEVFVDEISPEDDDKEIGSSNRDNLQRRRPLMRGRNVRTGKYSRPQITIGRSRSLDREVAMVADVCDGIHNNSENSSTEEHSEEDSNSFPAKHVDFKVPTYGSMNAESKVRVQQEEEAAPDRGRSSQRTTQNKRTSSFTRAVQHEMWAAANQSNNDSDGSGRAMVEATYRPPIVTVNEPHRMGSYAPDGIIPANLSSADSDSETDTLSLTSSDCSLVTVSHITIDSSSGTLTNSPQHRAVTALSQTSHLHTPIQQPATRQPASGQSESSPSTSQSSSPGDAAAAAVVGKASSICSKSSSGISSAASAALSQHHDPLDDIVVRASAFENRTQNRWATRHRPTSTMDIPPPPREFSSNQYSTFHGPQQYVTSRAAYSAQQQLNTNLSQQYSSTLPRYHAPRQTVVAQPPAFRSSKPSVAGGATHAASDAAFGARSSPIPSHMVQRTDQIPTQTVRQVPQEQQPVVRGSIVPQKQLQRYQTDQKPLQQATSYQQLVAQSGVLQNYQMQDHQHQRRVPVQQQPTHQVPVQQQEGPRSASRGPMQQFAWNRVAAERLKQEHDSMSRRSESPNPVISRNSKETSGRLTQSGSPSAQMMQQRDSYIPSSRYIPPSQSNNAAPTSGFKQYLQKPANTKRPESAPQSRKTAHPDVYNANDFSQQFMNRSSPSVQLLHQHDKNMSIANTKSQSASSKLPTSSAPPVDIQISDTPVGRQEQNFQYSSQQVRPERLQQKHEHYTRPQSAPLNKKSGAAVQQLSLVRSDVNDNNNGNRPILEQQQQRSQTPQMVVSSSTSIPSSVPCDVGKPLSSGVMQAANVIAQAKVKDGKTGQRPLVRRTYEISL